ncbi:MAG: hypothetical protein IT210_01445 [Armatimonadetes bacterium]|nr:hypothetical protein [Armatimonadota bacterium]
MRSSPQTDSRQQFAVGSGSPSGASRGDVWPEGLKEGDSRLADREAKAMSNEGGIWVEEAEGDYTTARREM